MVRFAEHSKWTNIDAHTVDGASGGFVAPFANPQLEWDFKLPRVVSINTSGHKFGLAYVGVGWVVWRDKAHLPKDLIFELHYLGSVEYSFSLNFSRPAAPIIAQYFNLIHLGFEGYRNIALDDLRNARLLSRALEKSGYYTVLSDIHRKKAGGGVGASIKDAIGVEDDVDVCFRAFVCAFHLLSVFYFSCTSLVCLWCPSGSPMISRSGTLKSSKRFVNTLLLSSVFVLTYLLCQVDSNVASFQRMDCS